MKPLPVLGVALLATAMGTQAFANDPPSVEHQPAQCTVAAKPIELCASVLDDGDIAKVRTYFRKAGEKDYFVTEMAFEGARFCATLPGVKEGKLKTLEYYIQATDTEYESKRTSTYQLQIQNETECGFPAVQKDAKKAAAIPIQATSAKQGSKLPDYFDPTGVTLKTGAGIAVK
jgi:hypothetical protein